MKNINVLYSLKEMSAWDKIVELAQQFESLEVYSNLGTGKVFTVVNHSVEGWSVVKGIGRGYKAQLVPTANVPGYIYDKIGYCEHVHFNSQIERMRAIEDMALFIQDTFEACEGDDSIINLERHVEACVDDRIKEDQQYYSNLKIDATMCMQWYRYNFPTQYNEMFEPAQVEMDDEEKLEYLYDYRHVCDSHEAAAVEAEIKELETRLSATHEVGSETEPNRSEILEIAYLNACDCLYYGYGWKYWNSLDLNDAEKKQVWEKAKNTLANESRY